MHVYRERLYLGLKVPCFNYVEFQSVFQTERSWKDKEIDGNFLEMTYLDRLIYLQHVSVPTRGNNTLNLMSTSEQAMIDRLEVTCNISPMVTAS